MATPSLYNQVLRSQDYRRLVLFRKISDTIFTLPLVEKHVYAFCKLRMISLMENFHSPGNEENKFFDDDSALFRSKRFCLLYALVVVYGHVSCIYPLFLNCNVNWCSVKYLQVIETLLDLIGDLLYAVPQHGVCFPLKRVDTLRTARISEYSIIGMHRACFNWIISEIHVGVLHNWEENLRSEVLLFEESFVLGLLELQFLNSELIKICLQSSFHPTKCPIVSPQTNPRPLHLGLVGEYPYLHDWVVMALVSYRSELTHEEINLFPIPARIIDTIWHIDNPADFENPEWLEAMLFGSQRPDLNV
jgi:hypothetical protein